MKKPSRGFLFWTIVLGLAITVLLVTPFQLPSGLAANPPALDIVVSNFTDFVPGGISFLPGNGDGTFGLPSFTLGNSPGPVGIDGGDFNNDGKRDVVVANTFIAGNPLFIENNTLTIFFGNAAGGFALGPTFIVDSGPIYVVAKDLNGDGKLDIAVVCNGSVSFRGGTGGFVDVLLGNGDGTFQPLASYPAGDDPLYLAVGDLNGDTKPDIAVSARQDAHGLRVLTNNGNGVFTVSPITAFDDPNTANPIGVAIADFNGDGKPDIAVANSGNRAGHTDFEVTVAYGDGTGGFSSPQFFSTGFTDLGHPVRPYGLTVGSFDAGSSPDLVTAGGDNPDTLNVGRLNVLLNNGSGGFIAQTGREFGQGGTRVPRVGFLNTDSNLDVAIDSGGDLNVYVLLGDGAGGFSSVTPFFAGPNPAEVTIGEFNAPEGIGPPANKDQCKNGGWQNFTVPREFNNQGDCIQFFNTGK